MKHVLKVALPCALLLTGASSWLRADEWDKKTDVTISNPIEIPGKVLAPGKYIFKLVDSPSNRHIVEVTSEDGKQVYAVMFTVAARRTTPSKQILSFYEMPQGQPEAVRYWFWPGELDGQEFTYPHNRAVEISKATGIDVKEQPSDFNPETAAKSSNTQVSEEKTPAEPSPLVAQAATPPPVEIAQNTPPAPPQRTEEPRSQEVTPAPTPVPSNTTPPAAQPLPQTASNLPLLALLGSLSLAAGFAANRARKLME